MLACTLNTTPVNLGSCGSTRRSRAWRGPGGGACSTMESSTSCTPQLLMAEPKNTGVRLPARKVPRTKAGGASCMGQHTRTNEKQSARERGGEYGNDPVTQQTTKK